MHSLRGFLLLLLATPPAFAQGLRLRIVDDSTGEPVRVAWVSLLRDGEVFAEALSRPNGTRFFPADPGGRYVAVVQRVGYEPHASPLPEVPRDTNALVVRALPKPIALLRSDMNRPRQCSERLEGLAGQIWAQSRIALSGAEMVTADGIELLALRRFERMIDRGGDLRTESYSDGRSLGTRLFVAPSPSQLSREGFVANDSTGDRVYYGPNASYFVAPEFLRDHCFSTVPGSAATLGMLGLRFQPRPDRRTPGIEGTLWVDGQTAQLRLLEFSYRAPLPRDARDVGGRVLFDQLPSGSWIARDWVVRVPIATQAGQLLGYREQGGETLVVPPSMLALADSIENARKEPGRIVGVVIDSLTNRALAGALVTTDMAGPRARTEEDGTFILRSVPAGWRRVTFSHPMLDSLGARIPPLQVRVGPDSASRVALGTPSLRTLKGGACDDSLGVLTGTVRDVATGAPADSAWVTLSWIEIRFKPDRPLVVNPVELVVPTDSSGRYARCVPAQHEITAFADARGARTGQVDVTPDDRRLSILDLAIDGSATSSQTGTRAMHGVVMYQDRTPILAAVVTLTEPERTGITDSLGRFRIDSIPGGTRVVTASALGHAPVRSVVTVSPGDTAGVRIFMRKVTTLDAVVVRASAGVGGRAVREIEARRRAGVGYRLTPVELLGFRHQNLDAVLRSLPFVRARSTRSGLSVTLPGRASRECTPSFWLDGVRSDVGVVDMFRAADILAVEVFTRPNDVPASYHTRSDCGAILLWTREGAKR